MRAGLKIITCLSILIGIISFGLYLVNTNLIIFLIWAFILFGCSIVLMLPDKVFNKIKDTLGIERELTNEERVQLEKILNIELGGYEGTRDFRKAQLFALKLLSEDVEGKRG